MNIRRKEQNFCQWDYSYILNSRYWNERVIKIRKDIRVYEGIQFVWLSLWTASEKYRRKGESVERLERSFLQSKEWWKPFLILWSGSQGWTEILLWREKFQWGLLWDDLTCCWESIAIEFRKIKKSKIYLALFYWYYL